MVAVHRNVEFAAAGGDQLGRPGGPLRPGPGGDVFQFGLGAGAEAEDLVLPAAVPVNGDPLQAQGVGRQIDLAHVVGGGLVGEVNRLGDRIVGELLEGRL